MKYRNLIFVAIILSLQSFHSSYGQAVKQNKSAKNNTKKSQAGTAPKANYNLLQGKWQSEDDKTNFLVFDKNHRKEIAAGMDKWDDEEFILSDHCQNESNQLENNPKEKDSYISCKGSDLCWYIMSLTEKRLTLQYLGRGNTLTYKRVKN